MSYQWTAKNTCVDGYHLFTFLLLCDSVNQALGNVSIYWCSPPSMSFLSLEKVPPCVSIHPAKATICHCVVASSHLFFFGLITLLSANLTLLGPYYTCLVFAYNYGKFLRRDPYKLDQTPLNQQNISKVK